jgi:hypothetical protein
MWFFFAYVFMQRYLIWGCILAIQLLQLEISCCMFMFYLMSTFLLEVQQHLEPLVPPEYLPLPDLQWHPRNETRALLEWNQLMKEWL